MRGNNLLTSSLLSLGKNIFFTPPPFFAAFFFYQSNSHEFPLETVLWVIQELLAECFGNLDRLLDVPCCLISSIWILDWNQNLGISLQVLHGGQGWPRVPGISVISMDSEEIFFTCGTAGQTQTGSGWCRYCPQLTSRPPSLWAPGVDGELLPIPLLYLDALQQFLPVFILYIYLWLFLLLPGWSSPRRWW